MKEKYVWHKQSLVPDLEIIECPPYDPIKDFRMDPSGYYVLIRAGKDASCIEVAVCDKRHVIIKVFKGKKSQDLYYTIFEYEKKHSCRWFERKDHIAYLGKELKKAELSFREKKDYFQE